MRILLLADVHHRPRVNRIRRQKTIRGLQRCVAATPCDCIVFLGDIVHGPDFGDNKEEYEKYLKEVLNTTQSIEFATVFGNHDDECAMTKNEILNIIATYPNALTDGANYVLSMKGETLLFIDSGTYYDGEESHYDTVKPEVIAWAKEQLHGKRAILFQHIIVPDICEITDGKRFKEGVVYTGEIKESPCPPDINTGELQALAPYLKAAVFGHDHKNCFEAELMGVKIIQCPGAGLESYDYPQRPRALLLDTETLAVEPIKL